jgi:hypothetical protein
MAAGDGRKAKPRLCTTQKKTTLFIALASLHRRKNRDFRIQLHELQSQHALAGMQYVERLASSACPHQEHAPADAIPHDTQHLAYGEADTRPEDGPFAVKSCHFRKMFSPFCTPPENQRASTDASRESSVKPF